MIDLTKNPVQEALDAGVLATAPDCPECGAEAVYAHVERQEVYGDDIVILAGEFYRCKNGHRCSRRFELDRFTKAEREEEHEKAIKRAEWMQERMSRFGAGLIEALRPGTFYRQAQELWPSRPDPDLHERYLEARHAAKERRTSK